MKGNILNRSIIEIAWRDFYDRSEMMDGEQSIIWRLMSCRYRMLLIKKVVTDKEVDDFMQSIAKFRISYP